MTDSINMSEEDALLNHGRKPVIYSNHLAAPIQNGREQSKSLAASEYLVRKPKEGLDHPGIPLFRAIFVIMNGAMGAGILNFPQAFAKAGGATNGMIIQLIMLVFITCAFLILAYCADKSGAQNFQQIIRGILGPKPYILTELLVFVYMFGTAIAYLVLIADQLEKVGEAVSSEEHWYTNRKFLLTVITLAFILPLCLPKHLGILSYTSTLGGLGVMYICFVATYKYFKGTYNEHKIVPHVERNITDFLTVVPTICFGYQCHVPAVSVYAELKRPTIPRFAVVCTFAMLFCCTAYSFTACFGYLTFGQSLKGDFLVNYHQSDVLANIARIVLALVVLSSYAACAFCGRASIEGLWILCWRMSIGEAQLNERRRRIITTTCWVIFSLLGALFIPDVDYVISVIGGIAALFILFYPGVCLVVDVVKDFVLTPLHWLLVAIGIFYAVMGVFLFGECVALAIAEDLHRQNLY